MSNPQNKNTPDLFWARVDKSGSCWLWQGAVKNGGYGALGYRGEQWYAHRLAWTLLRGVIPPGLTLDHLCRNPSCVNPEHLEPVTLAENIRRARKTHCIRGHEFSEENVYIRRDTGDRQCRACARLRDRIRDAARRAA